jgi:AcrR family transcriptional regulator
MAAKPTQEQRIRKASRQRREQQKAETRQAILDAAGELFREHGYEGFSLRQVAEQIGYSPGTIYLYFKNKDALLFTLVDEGFGKFGRMLREAAESSDVPREQLDGLFDAYVVFGLENPVHYRLMFMDRPDFMIRESKTAPVGHTWGETFMTLQHTVERCIAAGQIRATDAQSAADALWAGVHGLVALLITQPWVDEERRQAAIAQTLDMIKRGIDPD